MIGLVTDTLGSLGLSRLFRMRDYSAPLVLALLLHAGAVLALIRACAPEDDTDRAIRPDAVNARLVVRPDEPKPYDRAERERSKRRWNQGQQEVTSEPPSGERDVPESGRPESADEEEHSARDEVARQQRMSELAEKDFQDALEREAIELAAGVQVDAAMTYRRGIRRAVVRNWSRPPVARNGMRAEVLVELIPTGEVVSVTLVSSSGNATFDRSAEAAVRKARRFPVPEDIRLFEAHFRQFTLLFEPEDLLR